MTKVRKASRNPEEDEVTKIIKEEERKGNKYKDMRVSGTGKAKAVYIVFEENEIETNDITQIMDRAESAVTDIIIDSNSDMRAEMPVELGEQIINEMRKRVDEVVIEDLSDTYEDDKQ